MDIKIKKEQEKEIVSFMIALYCKKKHGHKTLCPECTALEAYARQRSDACPFMESKTFCSNCRVHCYKKDMREKIREVMRFSGPRMMFYHPAMAVHHIIESKKETDGGLQMKRVLYVFLGCVWIFHLLYFIFGVKTIPVRKGNDI